METNAQRLAWAMLLNSDALMEGEITHEEWEVTYAAIQQEIRDLGIEREVVAASSQIGR